MCTRFFFFSSRRRHTRCSRDWSSDVCSSDLVAALIVVLAVMTGFQDGIRDRIISANPHLLVFQAGGKALTDPAAVAERVRGVHGVRTATPFVLQQALFTAAGGATHGGLVRGPDFAA